MGCRSTPVFYFEKGGSMKLKYLLIAIVLLVYATGVDGYACETSNRVGFQGDEGYQ